MLHCIDKGQWLEVGVYVCVRVSVCVSLSLGQDCISPLFIEVLRPLSALSVRYLMPLLSTAYSGIGLTG